LTRLLSSLPVGAKVSIGAKYYGKDVTFLLADKKTENVLITEKIITIKAFDGKEASNSNNDRKNYGNNRYAYSNILSWLNSGAASWYEPKHGADAPPNTSNVTYNPYDGEVGFLTHIPNDIKNAIKTTAQRTVKASVDGGGSEIVNSKVYLPSLTEVGLTDEGGVAEGTKWELFSNDASRIAYPTAEAVTNSAYKDTNLSTSKGWHYWLRSPDARYANIVRCVYHAGSRDDYYAQSGSVGVRPALNLPSDILVSDAPNASGAYEGLMNTPPTITLDVQQNQVYYEGSTLNIAGKAKDTDVGDAVIVKYKIGSAQERIVTTQATQGKEFDYGKVLTFTKSRFHDGETPVSDVLLAGNTYQLQVWAQDDKGAKSKIETRNFTVVPNRKPLISITDLPTLEGGTGITELSIKGTVNDPDGDDVTLTYKLTDGKETPLVVVEEAFEIDFTVEQLRVGVNNFTIIARDEYEALTTTTVQVNVNKVSGGTEHIKKVAVFDLDMQGKETDGAVLWIRRPFTDDTDYTASISTVEPDAVESYSEMEKTTQIVQGNNRDQFTGKNEAKGSKVSIKLDIKGEGNISMIQGVIK